MLVETMNPIAPTIITLRPIAEKRKPAVWIVLVQYMTAPVAPPTALSANAGTPISQLLL